MKAIDFKRFVFENNIKQSELVEYLNVSKGYISLVVSGKKKLSEENLGKLLNNPYGWNTDLLTQPAPVAEVKPVAEPSLVSYLERKVGDQDVLIRELYQQIGALEKELELARKGETAKGAGVSLSADAI